MGMVAGTCIDVGATAAHISRKIREAAVIRDPWPHLVIHEFLPQPVFDALVDAVPEDYLRSDARGGARSWLMVKSDRRVVHSEGADVLAGREREIGVLRNVFAAIHQPREMLDVLCVPLGDEIHRAVALFEQRYEGGVTICQATRLMKDTAQYALRPHTDEPRKLVSIILYVRSDAGDRLGTMLFEPAGEGFACDGMRYHPVEAFRESRLVPFKANSALVFVRTDRSFHGVSLKAATARFARITLQSNFWLQDPAPPVETLVRKP